MGGEAIGDVRDLFWVGVVLGDDGRCVGFDEAEETTVGVELETGVQFLSDDALVSPGGEDQEMGVGVNGYGGESPFCEVGFLICEVPPLQIEGRVVGVVDFDPVGIVAKAVLEGAFVAGHELGDDGVGCEQEARFHGLHGEGYCSAGLI